MAANPSAAVLVVDDDRGVRELVAAGLTYAGHVVTVAANATEALAHLHDHTVDIVVLDIMLPGTDGLDLMRLVRSTGDTTAVLMLTARDAVPDRIAGLAAGADDYMTKPFDLAELVARVDAVLRRSRGVPSTTQDPAVLTCGELVVDTARMQARQGDNPIDLSPTEFRVLVALLEAGGRVLTKAQLLDRVWGYDFGGDTAVVEKVVSRLRRKIEGGDDAAVPHQPLVRTIRGFGYAIRDDE